MQMDILGEYSHGHGATKILLVTQMDIFGEYSHEHGATNLEIYVV